MPFSGFELSDELNLARETIARFVREEILPVEAELPPEVRELPAEQLLGLQAKARELGFWCLDAPEEFGGGGASTFEMVVYYEEMAKHRLSWPLGGGGAFGFSPPVVLYAGSEEQIERFVKPTIEHGWRSFTAISEPSGGSDPARSIRTVARLDGDSYVLNGRKMWATNADDAHYGVVYAQTGARGDRKAISAFIVERDTPGMSVSSVPVLRNHWTTEVNFEDCRIPRANLIGEEGDGFNLAQAWLVRGRLKYAAQSVGTAAEAVRLAAEWARDRETFGALLATRQGVQFPLADSLIEINAARWLTWDAATRDDRGSNARVAASMAKVYGTEMAFRVVDRTMQILGGMGVAKEMPFEHWFRDLRTARIVEGPSEIHRYLIARDLLGAAALGKREDGPPTVPASMGVKA